MPTELLSLAKLFNNKLFRIPDYQRGYAWGERQLSDFWSDLNRIRHNHPHYCGQLTLEKVADERSERWLDDSWLMEDASFEPYFVVDGQQRLTTAVILIQCLLDDLDDATVLCGIKVPEHRGRYLTRSKGLITSCLFGYENDNPSHEFFRTQILGVQSNGYSGTRTVYTANLEFARDYFRQNLKNIDGIEARERLFKTLTQRLRFSLHELTDDVDVFVAFETMNNRGKALSRLELLKNRLIYLSTMADAPDDERQHVRSNINAVWRTIYQELGRNPDESLDDDDFLRAHWIAFFDYNKDESDPLTRFLLNTHFTAARLESRELTLASMQGYATSLQASVRVWQTLHFPENHEGTLGRDVFSGLCRLKRLGFGVLKPLVHAVLLRQDSPDEVPKVLRQAERFLLLVRSWAGTRSHLGEAESYRLAHQIHDGNAGLAAATDMLKDRVEERFSVSAFQKEVDDRFRGPDGKGYYELPGIKYLLFEYEEYLRRAGRNSTVKIAWSDFRGARNSIEHIYPQDPEEGQWEAFRTYSSEEQRLLRHSLGNLVAVSVAKNASLSRRSFKDKKAGSDTIAGFSQGSFSELRIAQCDDWTPKEILRRGLELLEFIEKEWEVSLGDRDAKVGLLKLGFVEERIRGEGEARPERT